MSLPKTVVDEELQSWRAVLDKLDGDGECLVEAFIARWKAKSASTPPSPWPEGSPIASDHGWSTTVELFLLSKAERDASTKLIITAITQAYKRSNPDLTWGDVWLTDILALRRAPPPKRGPQSTIAGSVDLDLAAFIVGVVNHISTSLPSPNRETYYFFERVYGAIVNALVSEVVEANCEGHVWLEYQMGRRVVAPSARSVFPTFSRLNVAVDNWSSTDRDRYHRISAKWAATLHKLVETILLLNGDIEKYADGVAPDDRILKALARQFDWALYRLILADIGHQRPREAHRLNRIISALKAIHVARGGKYSAPAGFYQDPTLVGPVLWHGRALPPRRPPAQTDSEPPIALEPVLSVHWGDRAISWNDDEVIVLSITGLPDEYRIIAETEPEPST